MLGTSLLPVFETLERLLCAFESRLRDFEAGLAETAVAVALAPEPATATTTMNDVLSHHDACVSCMHAAAVPFMLNNSAPQGPPAACAASSASAAPWCPATSTMPAACSSPREPPAACACSSSAHSAEGMRPPLPMHAAVLPCMPSAPASLSPRSSSLGPLSHDGELWDKAAEGSPMLPLSTAPCEPPSERSNGDGSSAAPYLWAQAAKGPCALPLSRRASECGDETCSSFRSGGTDDDDPAYLWTQAAEGPCALPLSQGASEPGDGACSPAASGRFEDGAEPREPPSLHEGDDAPGPLTRTQQLLQGAARALRGKLSRAPAAAASSSPTSLSLPSSSTSTAAPSLCPSSRASSSGGSALTEEEEDQALTASEPTKFKWWRSGSSGGGSSSGSSGSSTSCSAPPSQKPGRLTSMFNSLLSKVKRDA